MLEMFEKHWLRKCEHRTSSFYVIIVNETFPEIMLKKLLSGKYLELFIIEIVRKLYCGIVNRLQILVTQN